MYVPYDRVSHYINYDILIAMWIHCVIWQTLHFHNKYCHYSLFHLLVYQCSFTGNTLHNIRNYVKFNKIIF